MAILSSAPEEVLSLLHGTVHICNVHGVIASSTPCPQRQNLAESLQHIQAAHFWYQHIAEASCTYALSDKVICQRLKTPTMFCYLR